MKISVENSWKEQVKLLTKLYIVTASVRRLSVKKRFPLERKSADRGFDLRREAGGSYLRIR